MGSELHRHLLNFLSNLASNAWVVGMCDPRHNTSEATVDVALIQLGAPHKMLLAQR
jgi:hypothetical protein